MKRVCLGPRPGVRCGRLVSGASRCPDCQRGRYQYRNATRDQFARRLYGSVAWKTLSTAVVAAAIASGEGCYYCHRADVRLTADHVVRVVDDYSRALDPSNVVACCRSDQEKRKHNREWWGAGRPRPMTS